MKKVVNPALMMVVHLDSDAGTSVEPLVSEVVQKSEPHTASEGPRTSGRTVKPD